MAWSRPSRQPPSTGLARSFLAAARARLPAEPGAIVPPPFAAQRGWRNAAVLVAVVDHGDDGGLILTQRTGHLSTHAGQIAFPGGKIDNTDPSAIACALREAEEEIGLDKSLVEVLGCLPVYATVTGFLVRPVVARVAPGYQIRVNAAEVEEVFEIPLSFLMSPANHRRDSVVHEGVARHFYRMPYAGRNIWGATAGIIRSLHDEVLG
ncbi:MAG: CoA pyrophosphatase [Bauldia sp.]|nr:CoA pyrophosphatase [Bauldia sp.]